MDSKKFGAFILELRKEKGWTQAELAEMIHVTDKAISRWERGVGFPDINTMKPLADALGVSVMEMMQSERNLETNISMENVTVAMDNMISLVEYHRAVEKRNLIIGVFTVISFIMLIFLLDVMSVEGFMYVCLPLILAGVGITLIVMSIHRRKLQLQYYVTLAVGIGCLLIPILFLLLLFFAFALGGPVAT